MKCGIKLTVDYAFKVTFGTIENLPVLMHLLNSILAKALRSPIVKITLLNPFSRRDQATQKLTIFDIKAVDETGREFIIEVQLYGHENFAERLVHYWAKEYAAQLSEGDHYRQLKPVFVVCITDANLFSDATQAHCRFQLVDVVQEIVLTEQLEVHVIQLPKFDRKLDELETDEDRWLYFI